MEWVFLFVGIIAGYFINKLLDFLLMHVELIRERRIWKKAERVWVKYQAISFGLEVIQVGWANGKFSEEQVIITVDKVFKLNPEIAAKTLEILMGEWEKQHYTNDVQYGVSEIDPHRSSDEVTCKTTDHQLVICGHTFRYFEFLSTNRMLTSCDIGMRSFVWSKVDKVDDGNYLHPQSLFANPLSVGLSLFCENGNYLVLPIRTDKVSSGGSWAPSSIYNAVGEMVNLKDIEGECQGVPRLSVWKTAKRGLHEELGVEFFGGRNEDLVIHSFVWDKRILDYKFFGYFINGMSQLDVQRSWDQAPDKHEFKKLTFHDTSNRERCLKIVQDMVVDRNKWGSECILCTIRSLLYTKKITTEDLDAVLSGYRSHHKK